ncbi:MAG: ComF family protein [Pseudomonadota bacterium]
MSVFLSWLYPPRCRLCGAPGMAALPLCPGCYRDLPWNTHPCPRCGKPLPSRATRDSHCGACQGDPPVFDTCLAPLLYADIAIPLVTGFKFRHRFDDGYLLATLLARRAARVVPRPQALLPVPMHPRRLRQRGFNQSLEIAQIVGSRLGIPVLPRLLRRIRHTPPQLGLSRQERLVNLRHAFDTITPLPFTHVALVDDVMTTGTTAQEVSQRLRQAGAECVAVWVVARTV